MKHGIASSHSFPDYLLLGISIRVPETVLMIPGALRANGSCQGKGLSGTNLAAAK